MRNDRSAMLFDRERTDEEHARSRRRPKASDWAAGLALVALLLEIGIIAWLW